MSKLLEEQEMYESHVVAKLFHNKELHYYLSDILPELFGNMDRRITIFTMKNLFLKGKEITIENIIIGQGAPEVKAFIRKCKVEKLRLPSLHDMVYSIGINTKSEMFEDAYKEIHNIAFARYTQNLIKDITFDLGYRDAKGILNRAKALTRVYSIIYGSKVKDRRDQIGDAAQEINSDSPYIRTFSPGLNIGLGGISRGFAATLLGKPSHGKSTIATYDLFYKIDHNLIERGDVVGVEESPTVFWRRAFAHVCKKPIKALMDGVAKITPEDIAKVKERYEGKIFFHSLSGFSDVADLIMSLTKKTEYILVDHVNSISYPNGDDFHGIKSLINIEKAFLKDNPDSAILNLSQANTKEMLKKGRLIPKKEDAYMSSILEQAGREFLVVYYPYKDFTDPEVQKHFKGGKQPPADKVQMYIAKNSFGNLGCYDLRYDYDHGRYKDWVGDTIHTQKGSENFMLELGLI